MSLILACFQAQSPPAKITVMSLLLVFGLVGAVLLTCMFVCGSIVWCLKRDRAYGVRPYTGRYARWAAYKQDGTAPVNKMAPSVNKIAHPVNKMAPL